MLANDQLKAISGFLLDCAKITFASLVVVVFVPGASVTEPQQALVNGIVFTAAFLITGVVLAKQ